MSVNGQQLDFVTTVDQFRMTRLQVYNWGTFDGLHDVPISDMGFLFVGRSGSGKTTLLDAVSALLIPPRWMDFNAAAREAAHRGRDRNLVTYVRGAWAERTDNTSGEIATHYLRKGPTWSALALTYQSTLNRKITLAAIFWIRGSSTAVTDVRRQYIIIDRPFDLMELQDFDLDLRRLKLAIHDAAFFDNFNPYRERFGRTLGIEKEMALRLLHKTQSAKNLGDLNSFLRDFMLDRPETFDVAERLVNEFAELSEAHQAVVTARDQVATLRPAREKFDRLQEVRDQLHALVHLQEGVDPYQNILRRELLNKRITELRVRTDGLTGKQDSLRSEMSNLQDTLQGMKERHRQAGGERIEHLEGERERKFKERAARLSKQEQAREACRHLEWTLPESPESFAERLGEARQELEQRQKQKERDKEERDIQVLQRSESGRELQEIRSEVDSMRRQRSKIPLRELELRHELTTQLNLSDDVLPFVGELIEVLPEEAVWTGAIERVLHGFALSILVEDRHYAALSTLVNSIHLGKRLVYYRTDQMSQPESKPIPLHSLVRKLRIKPGRHHDWLDAELRRKFDYECVDSVLALRKVDRGLTREGQVRHGPNRHEKDDRRHIDDPYHWVLGFDNRDKLAMYEKQGRELAERIERLNRAISIIDQRVDQRGERALHCNTLVNLHWEEIDVVPIIERIAAIDKELETIRSGNELLAHIAEKIQQESKRLKVAEDSLRENEVQLREAERQRQDSSRQLEETLRLLVEVEPTEAQIEGLDARFRASSRETTLENLAEQVKQIERALNHDMRELTTEQGNLEKLIELQFAEFIRLWKSESGDLDATLSSSGDFFSRLQRLELDGLPQYEHRFFELLKEQSNQNLATLNTELRQARLEIRQRLDVVNEGLKLAAFNEGTHLRIEVSDRSLPEVQDFKRDISEAISYTGTDDREIAEHRFTALKVLVERLNSQESSDRRWREAVLDVRQHVEFVAHELDEAGRQVEIYRSGAGKSGGQRQKLATTCLAAALKYQLGGADQEIPTYAPVVLDEAFDKADHDYTRMAMEIFRKLGFQMIVATPLKSVMTLEPFIGGACFVDISERQKSGVLLIEYDEKKKRLNLPEHAHGDSSVAIS